MVRIGFEELVFPVCQALNFRTKRLITTPEF